MSLRGKTAVLLFASSAVFGYELDVRSSSHTAYTGEPVRLTYTFSRTSKDEGVDFRFAAPELAHMKVLDTHSDESVDSGKTVWRKTYVVAPLQSGKLVSGVAAMNMAKRTYKKDAWGQWMPSLAWEQRRFESVPIFVNPVPPNVQAVGRFAVTAVTDTNETESGRPVRLTLSLKGCGNLEMAEPPNIDIRGVSVFEENVTRNAVWKEGCYYSESNRTYALVGAHDYTIPSVILRTFDPRQNAVVKRQTLPIGIHVSGAAAQADILTEKEEETMTIRSLAAGLLIGIIIGAAATLLLQRRRRTERKVSYDSLRGALIELFKHLDDPEAKKSVEAVEKYLYEGAEEPDRNTISKVLKRVNEKR